MVDLKRIEGNLKELSGVSKKSGKNISSALRSWVVGDVGEAIGFWTLHKARFWRIIKPLLLQRREADGIANISCFISPNQLRQGLCLLPNQDERYYKDKILREEQIKLAFRWDFLALKIKKEMNKFKAYPCLLEVKTHTSEAKASEDRRLFKKRDFSREKEAGFRIFLLVVLLQENWKFEATLEEL